MPFLYKILNTYVGGQAANEARKGLEIIDRLCDIFSLDIEGSSGLFTVAHGDTFIISNSKRIGLTEVALTQKVINGVSRLIEINNLLGFARHITLLFIVIVLCLC